MLRQENAIWEDILEYVQTQIPEVEFRTWFKQVRPLGIDDGTFMIGVPHSFAREWLKNHYAPVLEHALRPLFSYLHAVVVPTAVFAASEDWGASGGSDALRRRIDRAAAELAALVRSRPVAARGDQFDRDVAAMGSFEDLLGS